MPLNISQKLEENGFDEIVTILDEEATQSRILTELFHELPQRAGRNDRVVFYFAGHGQTEDLPTGGKRGYLLPVDADTSDYPNTAISMEQIRSLSSRIPAKHILYVMDSCYSGLGLNRSIGVSPKISDYLRKVSSMRPEQSLGLISDPRYQMHLSRRKLHCTVGWRGKVNFFFLWEQINDARKI